MGNSIKVTQKYQVTIPKEIRKDIKIRPGDELIPIKEVDGVKFMTVDQFFNKYTGIAKRKGFNAIKEVKWVREHMYD